MSKEDEIDKMLIEGFGEIDLRLVPEHMRNVVIDYLGQGFLPGHFLQAVLENKLVESYGRADSINEASMRDWAWFLYNEMPAPAWGSRTKVEAWCKKRQEVTKGKRLSMTIQDTGSRQGGTGDSHPAGLSQESGHRAAPRAAISTEITAPGQPGDPGPAIVADRRGD